MSAGRILVTGANGFVGTALCAELVSKGYHVVAAVRSLAKLGHVTESSCMTFVEVGNIDGRTDWDAALLGCSAVIHLAARAHVLRDSAPDRLAAFRESNVEGTVQLAKAALKAGIARFVFVSSIGVNGKNPLRPCNENDTPAPVEEYAVSKLEAEMSLQALVEGSSMQLVIVRPPLVYGPNCPGNFRRLLKLVSSGIPLPFGRIINRSSFIGVWNLADFLGICVAHPDAADRLFLVSDMDDLSLPDILRQLGQGMGREARLLPIPPALLAGLARMLGKSALYNKLCGSLAVDPGRARDVLGWRPPVTAAEGLRRTARWYAAERAAHRV